MEVDGRPARGAGGAGQPSRGAPVRVV